MIFSIEKRRKRKNGKVVESRCYYLRYRIGNMPCDKWVSLRVMDKTVANSKANKFIADLEREQAGLALPHKQVESLGLPVAKFLSEYISELKARRRDPKYIEVTEARISKVSKDVRWRTLGDVSPDSFLSWRRANGHLSAKTRNDYLASASGFCEWLVDLGRLAANPLEKVGKVDAKGDRCRLRRAFTMDELTRLFSASGWRSKIYMLAAYTGLRRNEVAELEWGDVVESDEGAFLQLRAAVTKNRKASPIPLHPQLAVELAASRPKTAAPSDKVFPRVPRMNRFRIDLKAAGIPYEDKSGRFADFHALRYTFATMLAVSKTGQRIAQELMRHSDPKLTAGIYTDAALLPLRDAVENLPWAGYTQIGAQISDEEGLSVSQADAEKHQGAESEPPENEEVGRALSHSDKTCQMAPAVGLEPTRTP
jgi:integrase